MKNYYKIKKTKKLIKQLKPYWKRMKYIRDKFNGQLYKLEEEMERALGIEGIEFFFCDNEIIGIGNAERNMELIHGYKELNDETS